MSIPVLLITPPFTQLNTPYPATAYLKGFLTTRGITSAQADLGIEVSLRLFSRDGLSSVFQQVIPADLDEEANIQRMYRQRTAYLRTIDQVIRFLQGKQPTMARLIAGRQYLPEASRFSQLTDLEWAFGSMGLQDKARHFATLYLEDLADYIKAVVDPHFGFSRYAERLGRAARSFDPIYEALQHSPGLVEQLMIEQLELHLAKKPTLVALSIPFPGNLFAGLRCAQHIRQHYPHIRIALGGGYANTELRSLQDARLFDLLDFVCLDDGEAPLEQLLRFIQGEVPESALKRTMIRQHQSQDVVLLSNPDCSDYKQGQVGTPDYSDLWLDQYLSVIEVINPMHSLWTDGRWNKLTMAHGCYWGKCTFCDISLDYIARYEPLTATVLCDRMEELIAQTGCNGFHFVDEAAPPALMRSLAIEIIRRGLVVSWWTNIRFEKSFTRDLCLLLRASGCIGVSGGLEVASNRLLDLIQKGITVEQVTRVTKHFTEAGILVHAYLMYGFPTQTEQETIDSLEMVRQLFQAGVLQSGFWHLFTMTSHSPVGLDPASFQVKKTSPPGSFANNDEDHEDPTGGDHAKFGEGLRISLYNYMHGAGFDLPLKHWFEEKVPRTTIAPDFIVGILSEPEPHPARPETRILFIGTMPEMTVRTKSKKGQQWEVAELQFDGAEGAMTIQIGVEQGRWLMEWLERLQPGQSVQGERRETLERDFESKELGDFGLFWDNKPLSTLFRAGLLQF